MKKDTTTQTCSKTNNCKHSNGRQRQIWSQEEEESKKNNIIKANNQKLFKKAMLVWSCTPLKSQKKSRTVTLDQPQAVSHTKHSCMW